MPLAIVPDLTNHTLPILPREMNRIAKKLGMTFVPCKQSKFPSPLNRGLPNVSSTSSMYIGHRQWQDMRLVKLSQR